MVRSAGNVPRQRFHRGERKIILCGFALAERVPGGQPVEMNFRRGHGGFQKLKRGAQARVEHFARHFAQLRFRIVQVIDVNRFDAQIAAAALELVGNEFRRHRVATGGDVAFAQNPGFHVLAIEIFAGVGGHVAVRREESALRADQQFFARIAASSEFRKRRAHGTFRALETVIDRGVDHVHAGLHGLHNRIGVGLVGARVRLPEIRANPQRREPQALLLAKVPRGGAPGKSRSIFFGAILCCKRRHLVSVDRSRDYTRNQASRESTVES